MKKESLILLIMLLSGVNMLYSQSNDRNYILTRTFTDKSETNNKSLVTIQYFDGIGRLIQTVQQGFSPEGYDLVTLQEYDGFGRESNLWLPVNLSTNDGNFVPLQTIKNALKPYYSDDLKPYSKTEYEPSPLNRVTKQFGPGHLWQNNNKSIETAYKTNTSDSELLCKKYKVSGDNLLSPDIYPYGSLYVVETTNEDGNISLVFTNKIGQTVLTRQINNSENHDTYYVYDDFGNLRFVLPPMIEEDISQTNLDLFAYQYRYDSRNRMAWKKLPGCAPIEYIYDKADRLIFWRDGELKDNSKWMFSISDDFDRVVLTGICSNSVVSYANAANNLIKAKKISGASGGIYGYEFCLNGNPVTINGLTILTVNYYDDYNFLERTGTPAGLCYENGSEISEYDKMYGNRNLEDPVAFKGLLTGTITAMLETNIFLYSAFYYDYRGQLIQTKSTNHLAGFEKEYIQYDFIGNPLKRLHIHNVSDKEPIKEEYLYTYDHTGRLLKTTHKLNNGSPKTIADNEYDEIGRLKSMYNTAKVFYTYDVRSRLNKIESLQFKEVLTYSYGGNIISVAWYNETLTTPLEGCKHLYRFAYDNLSRLKTANYFIPSENNPKQLYNEYFLYDKHGNITALNRYAPLTGRGIIGGPTNPPGYVVIDELSMTYIGNQLKCVNDGNSDLYSDSNSYFFTDLKPTSTTDYSYNYNGAMTKDQNKGMTVSYNVLNLPKLVSISNSNTAGSTSYSYSADGVKRKVKHSYPVSIISKPELMIDISEIVSHEELRGEEGKGLPEVISTKIGLVQMLTKTTDYAGNKIYKDGKLDMILLENGYIKDNNYHFYIRDHLGNNRVVLINSSNIVQRTNYYPSGLPFPNMENPEAQPYKYNGKEFDTEHGLNQYDYGARFYDAAIMRWHVPDPLTEKRYNNSPYTFCSNNPLNRIDPDGKWDVSVHVYKNRKEYGYGVAIVKDRNGNEVYRFEVRAEGTGGRDRTKVNADTPLGVYNIPVGDSWWTTSKGDRKKFGPNPRLVMIGASGEIIATKRSGIRIHGGGQETYNSKTGKWISNAIPILKKTNGCLRAFDTDMAAFKQITDDLQGNDELEMPGQVTIIDDLEYIVVPSSEENSIEVIHTYQIPFINKNWWELYQNRQNNDNINYFDNQNYYKY